MSSIQYSWDVASLECAPLEDSHVNVVKTIHWIRIANSDSYCTTVYGSVALPEIESDDDFIAYEDLTKDDVEEWLNTYVDVDTADATLAKQIEALKNPPVVRPPLPWNNS